MAQIISPRNVCETVSLERSTSIFVKSENVADIIIKRPALYTVATTGQRVSEGEKKEDRKQGDKEPRRASGTQQGQRLLEK